MSWSLVQANSSATTSVAFPSGVTAGNLLVLLTSDGSAGAAPTDTLGNSWNIIDSYAGSQNVHAYFAIANASGATTVTFGGGSFQGMSVAEFSYSAGGFLFDALTRTDGISTTHPTGSVTATAADSLAVAFFGSDDGNSGAVTAGGGATLDTQGAIAGSANDRTAIEHQAVGAGSVNLSWSMGNCSGTSMLAIFKPSGAATTGEKYATVQTLVAESPWLGNTWDTTPSNITGAPDGAYAKVTAATFDSGDQSFVLKATGYDFSAIPSGSTINGVTVRIKGAREEAGAGAIGLVQLLNTSAAKVGTNKASTEVAITSTATDYTFGSSTDLWANALTEAWVKDPDFGVALGMWARAANTDVAVDAISIEVSYTAPSGSALSATPSDTITLSDAAGKAPVKKPADTITLSDAITRAWVAAKALADTITATDAPSKKPALPKADTLTLSDATTRVTGKSQALADTLTLSDAAGKAPKVSRSDTLTLADALTRAWAAVRALADTTTLSDAAAKAPKVARSDTLTLTDAQVKAIIALRADLLTIADLADPQLSTGGSGLTKSLADILTLADALGQLLVLAKVDTVTLTDASAKAVRPGRADTLTLADAAAKAVGVKRADTVSLADALGKGIVVHPTDTVTSTDARGKSMAHAASDLVSLSDASAKAMGLRPGDGMTLSDVINIVGGTQSFTLSLADTLHLGDDLARALNGDYLGGDGRTIRTIILSRFGIY